MLLNKLFSTTVLLAVAGLVNGSSVIEANDKNIQSILKPGLPTMLDIYASWCGHCKKLSPVYDELSELFSYAKDKVQFVKIDGDINRNFAKQQKVEYFPTVKFINADGSEVDVQARDLDSMAEFVYQQTGISPKKPQSPPSNVVSLDDRTFHDTIKGKNAFVSFTADFCGHCKNMKPAYEELSNVYARDNEDLLIVGVDCSQGQPTSQLSSQYKIQGYPTLLFFPKDGSDPIPYQSGRSVGAFVDFINSQGVGFRNVDGTLNDKAGKNESLDKLVKKVVSSTSDKNAEASAVSELKVSSAGIRHGKIYARYADKYSSDGNAYVEKEVARLTKLISAKNLAATKKDELQVKLNILKTFQSSTDVDHEDL